MTRSIALAAAVAAILATAFMLFQELGATPKPEAVLGAPLQELSAVPGMPDLFHAEKVAAAHSDLPAQF